MLHSTPPMIMRNPFLMISLRRRPGPGSPQSMPIQDLMTAIKGKAASSPSPRAGASRPMASTSGPRILEPHARPPSCASSLYAQPSAAPDMMSEWASIKKELQELQRQVNPRQHHDVHMPNFNDMWVPSPSEFPKYRKYNGSGNPYIHIKDFIYESTTYQHDRCLMAYLFHRSLDEPALDWFYLLLPEDVEDFVIVKGKFLEQFQDRVGPKYSLTDLMAERMKSDEDFATYADRWRQMAT
ncbi:hypothetical protein Taro_047057 [Colocasia esculenta]|uniref:Retrotransposon gag domain-containing protein n=1 Tax=Colocasia esculenta TaxID=4460 RepID=A0A843X032_COLES|nr:hypothetical protein [Colocasia esculenta]